LHLWRIVMSEPKKPDSPMISILLNVVIPVAILSFLSKDEYLGPVWALVVGLAFPIGYGIRTLIRDRKADFISIIGIVSVTLTGVFGILKLPPEYVAIKEAAIPLILGIVIIASLKTPFPLIKKILMTEALFDVDRLKSALKEKGTEAAFEKRLVGLTWASCRRSMARLSVNCCSICAVSEKLTIIPTSPDFIRSISSLTWRFASPSREGFTSVACILAELSIRKMNRSPISCVPFQLGRNSAKAISSNTNSCSNSSKFRRSRCQIELTCRSSIDLCQRYVLGTSSGRRLSFRK
jgi:hypothetical protein